MAFNINNQSHSGRANKRSRIISEINVTPLVDVMLVLLIIFMVTSPMLVAGVSVDLPETDSKPIAGKDEPLSITVDKKGNVYIMDSLIKNKNIVSKLKTITKQKMDTRIFVRGDKNVSYGKVMSVVSQINIAGFSKVALITNIKQFNDK